MVPRTSPRGFTLVEVSLVIAILATIFAVGMANFRHARGARELEVAADELAGTLFYSRAMARAGSPVTATFSPSSCQVRTAAARVLRTSSMPSSVSLTVPDSLAVLVFAANGSASGSGTLTLTSLQTGAVATVTVAASTGAAVVHLP